MDALRASLTQRPGKAPAAKAVAEAEAIPEGALTQRKAMRRAPKSGEASAAPARARARK
jgi:hypothetical protein